MLTAQNLSANAKIHKEHRETRRNTGNKNSFEQISLHYPTEIRILGKLKSLKSRIIFPAIESFKVTSLASLIFCLFQVFGCDSNFFHCLWFLTLFCLPSCFDILHFHSPKFFNEIGTHAPWLKIRYNGIRV